MEVFSRLLEGFQIALSIEALLFCFVGVTVGTFVGVLPGIGAMAAISMALPLTFYMEPTVALVMLAGIFYGAQYGSSTAAILLNIPGTATSAVTCLDGHPMAKQGRAGVALFVTSVTSFVGGSISIMLLMWFAPLLSQFALRFSAPEYFSIVLLGLISASTLSIGSPLKGLASVVAGVAFGTVGLDITTSTFRFTYGLLELTDGLSIVAVAMGLFGVAEILSNVGKDHHVALTEKRITYRSMLPSRREAAGSVWPTLRGTALGAWAGTLPGVGPPIASFMAYAVEKRMAKDPSRFGHGAIEGVAAPEAANNAAVQSAFIPTLSLGIPGDAVMAILLGAMLIHGIVPGPQFIPQHPEVFWGLIASFWIGNVLLLVLNIPLIGMWVRVLTIPYHYLYPCMLFFICIGVFSIRNSAFDVYVTAFFGVLGLFMIRFGYPAAPFLLGFILGPLMEQNLQRALLVSRGDFLVFLERPISAVFLTICLILILASFRSGIQAMALRLLRKGT